MKDTVVIGIIFGVIGYHLAIKYKESKQKSMADYKRQHMRNTTNEEPR